MLLNRWQNWMRDAEETGVPHLGEFGSRIQCYRGWLGTEFKDEETRARLHVSGHADIECQQELHELSRQHSKFLAILDTMVNKLQQDQPPYSDWQEAADEFAKIQLEVERHNLRERQLIEVMARLASA